MNRKILYFQCSWPQIYDSNWGDSEICIIFVKMLVDSSLLSFSCS